MRVALFVTCFNDTLFPGTGRAVVELLERRATRRTATPWPSAEIKRLFERTIAQVLDLGWVAKDIAEAARPQAGGR